MAALIVAGRRPGRRAPARAEFRLGGWSRSVVLATCACFFLVPVVASARYALEGPRGTYTLGAVTALFHDSVLLQSLVTSVEISLGAAAVTLALLTPTSVWVNLRMPRLRRVMESLTLLPLVVPVVVVVLGIYGAFPAVFVASPVLLACEYVVLAMPYSYRTIDAGVQALELHTLVDASRSLGASWPEVFKRVLLPNLRTSLLSAAFVTVAYSLGEFAMANLLSFTTFPTELFQIGTEQVDEATAVSVFALLLTFAVLVALSLLGRRRRSVRGRGLPVGHARPGDELAAEVDAVLGTLDPGAPGIAKHASRPR